MSTPVWQALTVRGELSPRLAEDATDASGVYAVREKDSHRVVYVGESSRGVLWRTLLRHFQAPESFARVRERGIFTGDPSKYEVAIEVTSRGPRPRPPAAGSQESERIKDLRRRGVAFKTEADQRALDLQAEWIANLRAAGHELLNVDDGLAYEDETRDCSACGGDGEDIMGETCEVCHGSGRVVVSNPRSAFDEGMTLETDGRALLRDSASGRLKAAASKRKRAQAFDVLRQALAAYEREEYEGGRDAGLRDVESYRRRHPDRTRVRALLVEHGELEPPQPAQEKPAVRRRRSRSTVLETVNALGRFATVKQVREAGHTDAEILEADKARAVSLKVGNDQRLLNVADCIVIGGKNYQFVTSNDDAPAAKPAASKPRDLSRCVTCRRKINLRTGATSVDGGLECHACGLKRTGSPPERYAAELLDAIEAGPAHSLATSEVSPAELRDVIPKLLESKKIARLPARGRWPERFVITTTGSRALGTFDADDESFRKDSRAAGRAARDAHVAALAAHREAEELHATARASVKPAGYGTEETGKKKRGQLIMFNPRGSGLPTGGLVELGLLTRLEQADGSLMTWSRLRDAPVLAYDTRGRLFIVYVGAVVRPSSSSERRSYARTHWGAAGRGDCRGGGVVVGPFRSHGRGAVITYTTRKGGDRKLVDYRHEWGEGVRGAFTAPTIVEHACDGCGPRCAAKGAIGLAGGSYKVSDRGIVG